MKSSECILNEFDRIRSLDGWEIPAVAGFLTGLSWCFLNGYDTIDDMASTRKSLDDLRFEMEEFLDEERKINESICDGRLAEAAVLLKGFSERWPRSPEAISYERDIQVAGLIAKEFNDNGEE